MRNRKPKTLSQRATHVAREYNRAVGHRRDSYALMTADGRFWDMDLPKDNRDPHRVTMLSTSFPKKLRWKPRFGTTVHTRSLGETHTRHAAYKVIAAREGSELPELFVRVPVTHFEPVDLEIVDDQLYNVQRETLLRSYLGPKVAEELFMEDFSEFDYLTVKPKDSGAVDYLGPHLVTKSYVLMRSADRAVFELYGGQARGKPHKFYPLGEAVAALKELGFEKPSPYR